MVQIKIYRVNDCDWCAAETPEDAKTALAKQFGYEDWAGYVADYDDETPVEISPEEMDALILFDDSGFDRIEKTFREGLDEMIALGVKFPCFFASTEF